jgi:hypothetical protein
MTKPFTLRGREYRTHLWYYDAQEGSVRVAVHTSVYNRTPLYLVALQRYLKRALPFPAKFGEPRVEELTGDTYAKHLWVEARTAHELTRDEAVGMLQEAGFFQWRG